MTNIQIQKKKLIRSENDSACKDFLDVYFKECLRFLYNDLFVMIDWSIILPKELELEYKAKIQQFEEEQKVSYITSIERLGIEQGLS